MTMENDPLLVVLRKYLEETANAGRSPAKLVGIFELAPGVFGVLDRFEGQVEYDTYFDIDQCSITESTKQEQPKRKGLTQLGFDCLGLGPCPGGFDYLLHNFLKKHLVLKDGNMWHDNPKLIVSLLD